MTLHNMLSTFSWGNRIEIPLIKGGILLCLSIHLKKYHRFLADRYFKDEEMDELNKALFVFAFYNAGHTRIRGLRKEAKESLKSGSGKTK